MILSSIFTIASSLLIWWSQSVWVVAGSQVACAIAGSIIGPAMLGITLGVVKQDGFNAQNGRNQAYNHAGNVAGAAICGLLGWKFGFGMVFLMGVVLGTLSVASTLAIPRRRSTIAPAATSPVRPRTATRSRGCRCWSRTRR